MKHCAHIFIFPLVLLFSIVAKSHKLPYPLIGVKTTIYKDMKNGIQKINLLSEQLPNEPYNSDIFFYLYTKEDSIKGTRITPSDIAKLKNTKFNPKHKTVFVVHGWENNYKSDTGAMTKKAILNNYKMNIFLLDWSRQAQENYLFAMWSTMDVGQKLGTFINALMDDYGVQSSDVLIVGHSLGAHIAGNAGATTRRPIGHIIGLDPAGPLFSPFFTWNRLDKGDASYVQVIHTSGGFLGYAFPCGHVDYYPNGGMVQKGCEDDKTGKCSHTRPIKYLAESIDRDNFTAVLCQNYNDFKKGQCDNKPHSLMGKLQPDYRVVGNHYLDTNKEAPFAQG